MKNTFWLSSSIIISRIVRSLVIIYAARVLGTEGYGIFSYALSFAAIFNIFSDIGISSILTRELVKKEDNRQEYFSTALGIKLFLIIATALFIAIVAPALSTVPEAKWVLVAMAGILAIDNFRGFGFAVTRAQNKMQSEAGLEMTTELFITISGIIAMFAFPSPLNLALAYLLGNALGLIVTLVWLRKYFAGALRYFKKEMVRSIIRSAWPFAVTGVLGVLMTNIDSVIISFFRKTHDLGLYGAAQRPISMLYILPGLLSSSIFPILSALAHDKNEIKLSRLIQKSAVASAGLALPIAFGGIILAGPLVSVIYGPEYTGSVLTFQILLLTVLPVFPGMILWYTLLAEDKQKVFIRGSLIGAVLNIGLDLLLIPRYGIAGSAIATLTAQLALNGVFYFEARKNHNFSILRSTKKMMFATIIMCAFVGAMKYFSLPLVFIIPSAIAVYFSFLVFFKEGLLADIKEGFKV